MAIADGVLVDATQGAFADVSLQHLPGVHLAMTAAVFQLIQTAVESSAGCDFAGCWHDILWMSKNGLVELLTGGRTFKVGIRTGQSLNWHLLKILFHPGDSREPCATVMLPEEARPPSKTPETRQGFWSFAEHQPSWLKYRRDEPRPFGTRNTESLDWLMRRRQRNCGSSSPRHLDVPPISRSRGCPSARHRSPHLRHSCGSRPRVAEPRIPH